MVQKLRFFCSNKSKRRFRAEQNHSLIIGKLLYFLQEWVRKIHRNSFHHLRSQNIYSARRICIADQISPVLFHQFHIFQNLISQFPEDLFHHFRFFSHSLEHISCIDQHIENCKWSCHFEYNMFSFFTKFFTCKKSLLNSSFREIHVRQI